MSPLFQGFTSSFLQCLAAAGLSHGTSDLLVQARSMRTLSWDMWDLVP